MPIHLPAVSRRSFLAAAGAAICTWPALARGDDNIDADVVYFANDTHVGEKHEPDSTVPSNVRRLVNELTSRKRKPACLVINGDLALRDGQPGDYRHLAKLLQPLAEAKVETHLTMGNHDNREVFYEVLREQRQAMPPVKSRHVAVVETKYANLFLLDSLQQTMVTPGTLGPEQLAWLAAALDARQDKPALIVAHHNPRFGGDPIHYPGGLTDSQELWEVLVKRPQVKAYVHGHVHDREYSQHQGIHILNLPAVSFVADPVKSANGWTIAYLSPEGMTLETRTHKPDHPWNGQKTKITWRT